MFKKVTVESLVSKSKDILNVFNKTKADLTALNELIKYEKAKKVIAMEQLAEQERVLSKQENYNSKMITKIEEFLEE